MDNLTQIINGRETLLVDIRKTDVSSKWLVQMGTSIFDVDASMLAISPVTEGDDSQHIGWVISKRQA